MFVELLSKVVIVKCKSIWYNKTYIKSFGISLYVIYDMCNQPCLSLKGDWGKTFITWWCCILCKKWPQVEVTETEGRLLSLDDVVFYVRNDQK